MAVIASLCGACTLWACVGWQSSGNCNNSTQTTVTLTGSKFDGFTYCNYSFAGVLSGCGAGSNNGLVCNTTGTKSYCNADFLMACHYVCYSPFVDNTCTLWDVPQDNTGPLNSVIGGGICE